MKATFELDGQPVTFTPGQSLLEASLAAGVFIPHLCHHPDFEAHGSCRLCTVKVNGRPAASCTTPAQDGLQVEVNTAELNDTRRTLLQFLFVEGNHFCPSCEQSGRCTLQATGYALGVTTPRFHPLFPNRPVDASHPDILLDLNRCILCELCVRASSEVDGKHVFALSGRGITKHLVVNAESGKLGDTDLALDDLAAQICPVGVIIPKRRGFDVPIGQRRDDLRRIDQLEPGDGGAP
jgi:[NiFe] hydrogenase diaphorase moiety small subunit